MFALRNLLLLGAMIAALSVLAGLVPPGAPPDPGVLRPPYVPPPPRFDVTLAGEEDFDAEYILNLYWDEHYDDEMIEIRVWQHSDTGEYRLDVTILGSLGDEFWMNRISSVGPNRNDYPAKWALYDRTYCRNHLKSGTGAAANVDPYNDRAESLRAWHPDNGNGSFKFTIFEHEDYKGKSLPFKVYRAPSSNGYVMEIYGLDGHWNDDVSSIQTHDQQGGSYRWEFYKDNGFRGGQMNLYDGDDAETLGSFNDRISSIRLRLD